MYIIIEGYAPAAWRRIIVPADSNFFELHLIMQCIFE
ncbi:hypothetical protein BTW32_30590 [Bacillus thuringiensis]|nr:hypothetical protein BTW32_30590 [Bacillus thuringiensis]